LFKFGLQPYLRIAIARMPKNKLQQQKKVAMMCDEGITKVKGYN